MVKTPNKGEIFIGDESLNGLCAENGGLHLLYSRKHLKDVFCRLDPSLSPQEMKSSLQRLIQQGANLLSQQNLKAQLIRENQDLQQKLDEIKRLKADLEEGRFSKSMALKKASASLRKRIFFLKSLNEAVELKEVLLRIQDEARKTKGLGEAFLILEKENFSRLLTTNGRRVVEKSVPAISELTSSALRQLLADQLKRPIGPLIQLNGLKTKMSLFFEHQIPARELSEVVAEWRMRMVGLELIIDRFQLAQDLSEAALFWEKTFDGLDEPIGIFDSNNQVIRSNHLFTEDLISHLGEKIIRRDSQVYHVESYDIRMDRAIAEGSKVFHLSDQSSSFQLKQHMIQTEKIAALGQLAGHIAHELNNPLTGIRSLCQVLAQDSELGEDVKQDIQEVELATTRCQNIIKNLLEYSKPHGEDLKVVADVNEVVSNTLPLLKSLMGRHRNEVSLSDQPLMALVDPHMLQQVVFNLVANACQAMTDQPGEVCVLTKEEDSKVVIRVQDTGPGIPAEIVGEIFEPFFTTKPVGEGTGLGLSLSMSIIRGFGGDLMVDQSYDLGAAFVIILPKV